MGFLIPMGHSMLDQVNTHYNPFPIGSSISDILILNYAHTIRTNDYCNTYVFDLFVIGECIQSKCLATCATPVPSPEPSVIQTQLNDSITAKKNKELVHIPNTTKDTVFEFFNDIQAQTINETLTFQTTLSNETLTFVRISIFISYQNIFINHVFNVDQLTLRTLSI